jgi:ATP-dependent HslUV protease ATP-binding subunit HslU
MTPKEIVHELDRHIVGQAAAKKAVAIARKPLAAAGAEATAARDHAEEHPDDRADWRWQDRDCTTAGAAGQCAFVKVEATKFTEVGYVGRDVDTIIRDLAEVAIKQTREQAMKAVRDRALDAAEEQVLDALLPPPSAVNFDDLKPTDNATRQKFRRCCARDSSTTRKSRSKSPWRRRWK